MGSVSEVELRITQTGITLTGDVTVPEGNRTTCVIEGRFSLASIFDVSTRLNACDARITDLTCPSGEKRELRLLSRDMVITADGGPVLMGQTTVGYRVYEPGASEPIAMLYMDFRARLQRQ